MSRSTMVQLIQHLRLMIGDSAAVPTPQFIDDDLQIFLDRHREVIRYAIMKPEQTPAPFTGIAQYLDFYADNQFWESDVTFYRMNFSAIIPDMIDCITGHISFNISMIPPIFIVGKYYDMNGAAADALDAWASAVALQTETHEGDAQYNLQQKSQALLKMSEIYRKKAWSGVHSIIRNDTFVEGNPWGF